MSPGYPCSIIGPVKRDNVELVREVLDVYEREGLEAVFRYADPEVEIHMAEGLNKGDRRGIDEGVAFTTEWDDTWEDASYELTEIEAIGDETVLATVETSVRGAGSGVAVKFTQWWVFGIRDERFVRWFLYYDRESAVEAARG
jgi:ketosteroid isomerase-like protein